MDSEAADRDAQLVELGRRLEARRKELGLKVLGVADRAGISRNTIWVIERGADAKTGRPQRPQKDNLERWLDVLEFPPAERAELLALAGHRSASQGRTLTRAQGRADRDESEFDAPDVGDLDAEAVAEELADAIKALVLQPNLNPSAREEIVRTLRVLVRGLKLWGVAQDDARVQHSVRLAPGRPVHGDGHRTRSAPDDTLPAREH